MKNTSDTKKILVTGGSGLLGGEVSKLDSALLIPTHHEMDITDTTSIESVFKKYSPDIVLHLAAATNPPQHEKDPRLGLTVNILGTANLALACHRHGVRMVYVSTDYVYTGAGPHHEDDAIFAPSRFVWSKLGGEAAVSMLQDYLILRLSFGPVPFPWDKVYQGQYNSKLYADEMAPLVLRVAKTEAKGIMNIGGPRVTLESYAQRTRPDIAVIEKPDWVPADTSLDLTRMKSVLSEISGEENCYLR